ncbi:MAG TPA: alpha/beta fold hydrolase [Thermohalobaculum sp.]|nr:alpha/beta fold hydrolase [Thermohalobaculum sp.]
MAEDTSSQGLEFRVLGSFEVLAGGVPAPMPPSRKTRALLAYLALAERPVRRERLCEIFWELPDDPKGALRWSLSKIRRILNADGADRLLADRATVAVERTGIAVDRAELQDAVGQGLEGLPTQRLEALAAKLRGPFLEDLALPRCPEFEAWRTAEAAQAEAQAARLLRLLVERLRDAPERALGHAVRLRAYDPDDGAVDALIGELRHAATQRRAPAEAAAEMPEAAPAAAPSEAPEAARERCEVNFCTAPDGVRIAWSALGEGPPILRAAHWMSHLQAELDLPRCRSLNDGLASGNRLIRYDMRANGLSDWDAADLSFEAMVADLEAVADASRVERFTLLGTAQGAATAIAYAARHPERVAGLVLYGGYARGWKRRGDPGEIARRQAIATLMREGWGQQQPVFRQLFASLYMPAAGEAAATQFAELQRLTVSPENAWRLQNAFGEIDVSALLGQVAAPTLVLHARGDAVTPIAAGRELAREIEGARFVELDSDNHFLLRGEPAFDAFIAEVRAFARTAAETPAPPVRPRQTRRQVTALELDIVSPLQAFEALDPELSARALGPLVDTARHAIEANGGVVLEAGEAGLTAVFGAREASEVHAVFAARAALAVRAEIERVSGGRARARLALDAGEAIVSHGPGGLGVSGPVLRNARRLTHALRRAVVAATDRVRASAGGYVRVEPLHRNEHPGFAATQPVHEVLALNSALSRWYLRARRGLTRFVGRHAEIELMAQLWRHVREGRGQAVVLTAEPGVGKSRLTHEFLTSMAAADCQIAEGGALEFDRDVAYAVVKRLLRSLLAITEGESARSAGDKLARALERHGADPALETPLAFVLDLEVDDPDWERLPSEGRAGRIAEAMRELAARLARAAPLVMLIEDMHWTDRESRAVIDGLVEGVDRQRVLLILTCRPEFRHDWARRSSVHALRLHPLSIEDAEELVRGLVGEHPSVATLRRLLVERTDGTPLFIEETVLALEEAGRIVGSMGSYVAPQPIVDIETASSVEPVIASRIERLPARERALLQTAAVLGRSAARPLLKALSGLDDATLAAALGTLGRAEFLYEVMTFREPEYTFRHALIRDVAYASLMGEERRERHAEALRVIERLYADSLAEQVEQLATHAYRAGQWEAAARYLPQAAERAIERSAYRPATLYLERAIEALDALPETLERLELGIDVRSQLRLAYMVNGDYVTAVNRLKEARDLAGRIGDTVRELRVLVHLSFLHSTFGRLEKAIRAADQAREIAARHGLERYVAEGDLAATQGLLLRGDAGAALDRLEPWFERFTAEWRHDRFGFLVTRAVWYLGCLTQAHALVGGFERAARHAAEAAALAEETRRPLDAYAAQYYRNLLDSLRGPTEADLTRMQRVAEDCLARAPYPFSPWLLATWGYAQMQAGRREAAERTLERALEAAKAVNMLHFVNFSRGMRAWVRALGGDPGARDELLWASRRAEKDNDRWLRIRVLEALAGIAPDPAEAAGHLREAARIAEACGYRPLEARTLLGLARRLAASDPAAASAARDRAAGILDAIGLGAEAEAARNGLTAEA